MLHHSKGLVLAPQKLNRDWIYDSCVSSRSHGGSSIPLPTITTSRNARRFQSVELDTPYIDGGHLHVSSAKVESYDKKIPAPTRRSQLWPNSPLKDIANKNSSFVVRSVAP